MDDCLRASDADRDRAAAQLHVHFAAGRLTPDEMDDRLTAVLAARTLGDLRRTLADLPGPAPGLQQAVRLERGYRRLLAFYPPRHRRVHEDEMLAVLMTGAPDGKRRPGLAEAVGLILGALRVRCQPSRRGVAGWRGVLALASAGAVLGLLSGAAFAAVNPPLPTSYALVSTLPNVSTAGSHTEAAIADSRPVLAAAAQAVRPTMSLHALQSQVQINSVVGDPSPGNACHERCRAQLRCLRQRQERPRRKNPAQCLSTPSLLDAGEGAGTGLGPRNVADR